MARGPRTTDRDTVIKAAIYDGKIRAADADHYRRLWDANPAAIRNLLTAKVEQGGLMPGLVGSGGNAALAATEPDAYDEAWLNPRERAALAKRRTAKPPASASPPPPAGPAPSTPEDAYPEGWLSGEERARITAAKEGRLVPDRVEFEDAESRRAASAGAGGRAA